MPPKTKNKSIRILVVDDQSGIRETLRGILSKKGYEVSTAENGVKAVAMAQTATFDIVFMDIRMPEMNGVDALIKIKERSPKTAVVMMTAFAVEEEVRRAVENGAFAVVSKPFPMAKILETIEECLDTRPLIMVVDDGPEQGDIIKAAFESKGLKVVTVASGEECLRKLKERQFQVILMDVRLPGMDGIETLREAKKIRPDVACITMTAYSQEGTLQKALESGSVAAMEKPLDIDKLIGIIDKCVARKSEETPVAEPASREQAAYRLLIVDDDESLGRTLQVILQKAGYRAERAGTGQQALETIQAPTDSPIRCAFIDVRLPDMDGLELLRQIKELRPELGAIVMTGNTNMETAVGALNRGAFAYIQKPYNIEEVKAALNRLIENQELVTRNQALLKEVVLLNADLEQRVRRRTQDIEEANLKLAQTVEMLRRASAAKSDFVGVISHELRTPLTSIMGFAEAIPKTFRELSKEQIMRFMDSIHKESQRLLRILDEILVLSKIWEDEMPLSYTRFDIQGFVSNAVEHFKSSHPELTFEQRLPNKELVVSVDKDRLQQVLVNLLSNAVKYSPSQGIVLVSLAERGGELELSVMDQGPGISGERKTHVFEPFFRTLDDVNLKHPGTGLGLTLSRAIIKALGGDIRVEDGDNGRGSRFIATFPREPRPGFRKNQENQ